MAMSSKLTCLLLQAPLGIIAADCFTETGFYSNIQAEAQNSNKRFARHGRIGYTVIEISMPAEQAVLCMEVTDKRG